MFVDEVLYGHQFDRCNAQSLDIREHFRVAHATELSLVRVGDSRVLHRESAHIALVKNSVFPGHARATMSSCRCRLRRRRSAARKERCRPCFALPARARHCARSRKQRRAREIHRRWSWHRDRAAAWPGCSAVPAPVPRPVHPIAVTLAGLAARHEIVPDAVVAIRQLVCCVLGSAGVKQAQLDTLGNRRVEGELRAVRRRRGAELHQLPLSLMGSSRQMSSL